MDIPYPCRRKNNHDEHDNEYEQNAGNNPDHHKHDVVGDNLQTPVDAQIR